MNTSWVSSATKVGVLGILALALTPVAAQQALSPEDRAEIQQLSARYYEDAYVRTPAGGWRFKSRVYVPGDAPADGRAGGGR